MSIKDFPEELLSGFIDGELEGESLCSVTQVINGSAEYKENCAQLLSAGQFYKRHCLQQVGEGELKIWDSIESQLSPKKASERVRPSSFWDRIDLATVFGSRASYAVVGAFCVALFMFGMLTQSKVELPSEQMAASNTVHEPIRLIEDSSGSRNMQLVAENTGGMPANFQPRFIRPYTLSAEHPARSAGYRANGDVEILWMKSPRQLRLIRAKKREVPSVMWVGDLR